MNKFFSSIHTFDALRYFPDFRFLLASNFLYSITEWMKMLVMSWLAYEITGSPFMVAVFAAARMFPQLAAPFFGVIADMVNRKKAIIVVRFTLTVFLITLAILVATNRLEFWHLVVIGFLQGVFSITGATANGALIMDIVGKDKIVNAIALNTVASDVTRIVGPALGGILIAFLGPANCFWVAIGPAFIAIASLFWVRMPTRITMVKREPPLRQFTQGASYAFRSRDILALVVLTFSANFLLWPITLSFMPVFAKDSLKQGALGLGILQTVCGAGAFIGALILASLGDLKRKGAIYLYSTFALVPIFSAFALSHSFPIALLLLSLAGIGQSLWVTIQNALMLTLAPENMRGRILGFLQFCYGGQSLGSLAIGAATKLFPIGMASAMTCGILTIVTIAIAIAMPNIRRLR